LKQSTNVSLFSEKFRDLGGKSRPFEKKIGRKRSVPGKKCSHSHNPHPKLNRLLTLLDIISVCSPVPNVQTTENALDLTTKTHPNRPKLNIK
jgi:hypothetical protein